MKRKENIQMKNDSRTQSGKAVGSGAWLAEQIARRAHANQFRRDGVTPYIAHIEAVVKRLAGENDDVIAAAWLHDVIEDTCLIPETLRQAGIPDRVVNAVIRLTKTGARSYDFYLEGVKENEIARKVKVADMLHNLSDEPTKKQILKYAQGLVALLG